LNGDDHERLLQVKECSGRRLDAGRYIHRLAIASGMAYQTCTKMPWGAVGFPSHP
jgi:hypothetical protein